MKCWKESCFVIYQVWAKPTTVKSDFARERAETLSWAVSRGYITTEIAPWSRVYGNVYKATSKGLAFIEEVFRGLDRESILSILDGKFDEENEWFPR